MTVVGIDVGSSNCVIAAVGRGVVNTVPNEISERLTPSLVAFSAKERLLGVRATPQSKSNWKNTCKNFNNLLGARYCDESWTEEKKFCMSTFAESENGSVGYKVQYKGKEEIFSARRLTAALLTQLKNSCERECGKPVVEVVVSCPAWFTNSNRSDLLNATNIAGLNCLRIMSEHTATALDYGIYRVKDFSESTVTPVAFLIMGSSTCTAFVASFTSKNFEIISQKNDPTLGGRNLDRLIVDKMADDFIAKHKIDPRDNPKAFIKMMELASNVRRILSANADACLNAECLVDDIDVQGMIRRAELTELAEVDFLPRLRKILEDTLQSSGLKASDIYAVEMVGGTTRTPMVQELCMEIFEKERVSHTLSADECVARGCALQAAMCSKYFKVKEYGCVDHLWIPIALQWEGAEVSAPVVCESSGAAVDPKDCAELSSSSLIIMPAGMNINLAKKITFKRSKPFTIKAVYADAKDLSRGTDPTITTCKIDVPQDGEVHEIQMLCSFDVYGIFTISGVCIKTETIEEEKVMEKRPVGGAEGVPAGDTEMADSENGSKADADFEEVEVIKKVPKITQTEVKYSIDDSPMNLSAADMIKFRELELNMDNDDRMQIERLEAKNECETYVYDMRHLLGTNLSSFVDPKTKESFLKFLSETEEWLYDQEEAAKSVFAERLAKMKETGDPITNRSRLYEDLPLAFDKLKTILQECRALSNSGDQKYSHIGPDKRAPISVVADQTEKWLYEMSSKVESTPRHQEPVCSIQMILDKQNTLISSTTKIMNEPPPLSKKAEAPPPEATNENVDDEEFHDANPSEEPTRSPTESANDVYMQ